MLRQGTIRIVTKISNCVQILPFFATKSWISEQVVRVIAFRCHPILVISPSDTVQFIDQVRKPTHTMACLGAGIGCCISWYIWPLIRVRWKREWGMWIFAVLQTSRGTGKMSLAAFRWRAVDLKLVKLMHFWFAIAATRTRRRCEKEGTQGKWGDPDNSLTQLSCQETTGNPILAYSQPRDSYWLYPGRSNNTDHYHRDKSQQHSHSGTG
jgi:hypothetical protein